MRLAFAAALLVSCLAGCGDGSGTQSFTGPAPTPPPTLYTATLTASSACASRLPAGEAVRVYQVTQFGNGDLHWSAPTIIEPDGHRQISTLKVDGASASLTIGLPVDPQSDAFNGVWENLGGGRELAISGNGSGRVQGSSISGTFGGDFVSTYESSGVIVSGSDCQAADHHFTFAPR